MKIGVVTAFHGETEAVLRRCVESVRAQGMDTVHYLIGDGRRADWLDTEPGVVQLALSRPHRDYGDTPRAFGAVEALKDNCEAIAFLDADNWYLPDHLSTLARTARTMDLDVVTATRCFVRPDGSLIEGLKDESPSRHTDTSCFFLTGRALRRAADWGAWPRELASIGDRILWRMLCAAGLRIVHVARPTVAYTTTWIEHYASRGETPPPGAKSAHECASKLDLPGWWRGLRDADRERIRHQIGLPDFELLQEPPRGDPCESDERAAGAP